MPKGLSKATNYYNRLEAQRDWKRISQEANDSGFGELVAKHTPPEGAGWRKIDKCIAALRDDIKASQTLMQKTAADVAEMLGVNPHSMKIFKDEAYRVSCEGS